MGFVYEIKNLANEKRYIGSTTQLKRRLSQHFTDLRGDRHYNKYLQNAFNKSGEDCFVFNVLEESSFEILADREKHWIEKLRSCHRKFGYNLTDQPYAPMRGKKHTVKSKIKMSDSRQGKKHPNAKLDDAAIVEIFRLFRAGFNAIQIGEKVQTHHTNISLILHGKGWRHLGLNLGRKRTNNKSGCVGVYKTSSGKWKAEIIVDKKYHNLGIYSNKKDAVKARKAAEKV